MFCVSALRLSGARTSRRAGGREDRQAGLVALQRLRGVQQPALRRLLAPLLHHRDDGERGLRLADPGLALRRGTLAVRRVPADRVVAGSPAAAPAHGSSGDGSELRIHTAWNQKQINEDLVFLA